MGRIRRIVSRFLLNKFYRKLWMQIAIALTVITSIPVVLLGLSLLNTSQDAVRKSVLNNHKEIIIRTAEEIGLLLKQPEDILNSTAALLGVSDSSPWRQETILVELALNQPVFMRVFSLDLSGNLIASSDLGGAPGASYDKDAIPQVLNDKIYISRVSFQDNHTPYLTIAVPVKKRDKTSAILMADINLRGLWDIADNIRLDNTGRVFLVSNDGTLIAHPDKKRVLKNENLKNQQDINAVLSGVTGAVELQDKDGKKWISSYAPIPDFGWGVILRQEQREAYLFSRVMKMQSWVIIIFSEMVAILFAIFMARIFAWPVSNLLSRARSVSDGSLDGKIRIKRHDEIGELIKIFNELTYRLKKAKTSEKFSSIGEATGWVVHELKNSLVPIKSFIQLFPQRRNDDKFIDKFSNVISEEIGRWEAMLKKLSGFSTYSELDLQRVNIVKVVGSVLEMMEDKFTEEKIEFEFHVKNNNLYTRGDHERLKQVFINLVINAVNAMPGGGRLVVSLDLVQALPLKKSSYIEVSINDTGIGIPEELLKNIFEPFGARQKEGMGLGLAISRRIVECHKGEIRVASELGAGTTFTVRLLQEAIEPKEANITYKNILKNN
ncbi:MAG: ATP-binding protein [Candidatus Omnitrophica bacterium]|nr:ATP-binding protein [Candidatus Omnitrophota bacterium]